MNASTPPNAASGGRYSLSLGLLMVSACAPMSGEPGMVGGRAATPRARQCLGEAIARGEAFVQSTERYDDGDDGQVIGAGIAAALGEGRVRRDAYRKCMARTGNI